MTNTSNRSIHALVFNLGDERYAIDTTYVCEIRAYEKPHPVPAAPDGVKGVSTWRNQTVTVVDLRERFSRTEAAITPTTLSIVLKHGNRLVAAIVDAVEDVIVFNPSEMQPVPDGLRSATRRSCVEGLLTRDEKLLVVVSGEHLLCTDSLP